MLLLLLRRRFVAGSRLGGERGSRGFPGLLKEEMLERRNERLQLAFDKGDVPERRRNSVFSFGFFIRSRLLKAVSESVASFALLLLSSSSSLHLFRLRLRDVEIRGE